MKKVAKRKLVLGQEIVKVLVLAATNPRLQDARGGYCAAVGNSFRPCTETCSTIDQ